jgi:LacI family transcriptional regulator
VDSQKRLENYYAELPYSRILDGLILLTLPINKTVLQRFTKNDIPVLLVENHLDGYSSIEFDNKQGGKLAAKHLIDKGYTRFAYIGNNVVPGFTLNQEEDRLEGFKQELSKHNIQLDDPYIILSDIHASDHDQKIHDLLTLETPPNAIFTSSDELALQVLKIAKSLGIKIPQDLALIGFDNIEMASYLELTTISQSLYKSGEVASERIIALIADPNRPAENSFIRLQLIERSTT